MRFLADGPEIPDDLLVARDEGKVLFFCGSGVSRARAELPGFLGLAEGVMGVASSTLSALARAISSCGSEISAG